MGREETERLKQDIFVRFNDLGAEVEELLGAVDKLVVQLGDFGLQCVFLGFKVF